MDNFLSVKCGVFKLFFSLIEGYFKLLEYIHIYIYDRANMRKISNTKENTQIERKKLICTLH